MPIYNNPAIGEGFKNLASIFAPPSGSDLAGYATAGAKREEAARLAEMFNYARDPAFNQSTFDRLGQAAGQWNPANGYYAVDTNAATTRRGQDLSAATSLQTNAADNVRALEQTRLQGQNDLAKLYATPVTVAQGATVYVPGQTADASGLPRVLGGNINVGQGERTVTPDGRVIEGAAKPLGETEVKAQLLQALKPNEQRAVAMQGVNVEQVIGPDGKPTYVNRPDAAGQTPVATASDNATEITKLIAERDRLPAGDPNRAAYDARISALGRGQQQSAYDKASDETFAKMNEELFTNASKSLSDRDTYRTILAAVDNPAVDQGVLAGAQLQLRKTLNAFGVDAGNTSPAEMLNALGAQLSLRLRDPSSGAGMPGAMSDADRQFLQSMSVSLGNSPEANRMLAQYFMAVQQRNVDLNDLRQQYVTQHGRIDEGFRSVMADYLKNTDPTATLQRALGGQAPAQAAPAPQGGPAPGTVEDGHVFKGGNPADPNNWEVVR